MFNGPSEYELWLHEFKARSGLSFNLQEFCYPKQYDFVADANPFACALATRRAGKTTGSAGNHIDVALRYPKSESLYIALSRIHAKRLMWPIAIGIKDKYKISVEPNVAELKFTFPNGSIFYLDGANDSRRIENFRGMKLKLVTIDEPQSMRSYIETLVDDILAPTLLDEGGFLRFTGTPGPVPTGYFYKVTQNKTYSQHRLSLFDNPHIKDPWTRIKLELERRGVDINHPSVRREYFGEWATDPDALVIKYDETRNHFDALPKLGKPWQYVIGVDLGYHDSDAIAVLAFNTLSPVVYLVEEIITSKQGITPLVNQLNSCVKKYDPNKIVMDTGGLGKKIAEEITQRFKIPVFPAEKTRKLEFIELLNDALRTARFMAKKNSKFAEDSKLLEWDRDEEKKQEKQVVSENFHSDVIDAALYAYRESTHWTHEEKANEPKPGTQEYFDKVEREHEDYFERELEKQKFYEKVYSDPFES